MTCRALIAAVLDYSAQDVEQRKLEPADDRIQERGQASDYVMKNCKQL